MSSLQEYPKRQENLFKSFLVVTHNPGLLSIQFVKQMSFLSKDLSQAHYHRHVA